MKISLNSIISSFKKSREEKIIKECGNICFCPECREPLNDNSQCEQLDEDGLYEFTCEQCGFKPNFHFGIAPVPIYIAKKVCTSLVVHIDMFEKIQADNLNIEIDKLKKDLSKVQDQQDQDMNEVNTFQKVVKMQTADLILELVALQKELHPEDEQADEIKDHYEKMKNPPPVEPTKFDRLNEDKALKKLYMKLAKIYHPDKAPKGKKEEYEEIFKTLGILRQAGDLEAMKKFSKTLKKFIFSGGLDLDKLKNMRKQITSQILKIKQDRENFLKSEIYSELLRYKDDENSYIESHRVKIKDAINRISEQLEAKRQAEQQYNHSGFGMVGNKNIKN